MDCAILKLTLLLPLAACHLDDPIKEATEYSAGWSATDPALATTTETTPTTGDGPGVLSVTGDVEPTGDSSSTTTSSEVTDSAATSEPPESTHLVAFSAAPNPVEAVGPVVLKATAAGAVEKVELEVDGELLATGPGPSIEAVYEALSSVGNGPHKAIARVWNRGAVADEKEVNLVQVVPDGGQAVWNAAKVPDGTTSGTRLALYGEYTFVVGTQIVAGVPRMLVRCYSGEVMCWSTMLNQWTMEALAKTSPSGGVDIEVDEDGIVVAGNLMIDGRPRRYHARLNFAGELASVEWIGNLNEFAGGLALGSDGAVVVAGGVFTDKDATLTDVAWWSFAADGLPLASPVWAAEIGDRNEVATDVAFEASTGRLFFTGRRDVVGENMVDQRRQLVLKYTLTGALLGTFTSAGGFGDDEEASSIVDVPGGPCITGWAKTGNTRHALTRCLTDDLAMERWGPQLDGSESANFDIHHNRAGLLIVAGVRTKNSNTRARVEALQAEGAPLWFYDFPNPDGQADEARGVRCDPWGRCRWTGWQSAGGIYLVVGELTP